MSQHESLQSLMVEVKQPSVTTREDQTPSQLKMATFDSILETSNKKQNESTISADFGGCTMDTSFMQQMQINLAEQQLMSDSTFKFKNFPSVLVPEGHVTPDLVKHRSTLRGRKAIPTQLHFLQDQNL